jgi:uncharacterized protein
MNASRAPLGNRPRESGLGIPGTLSIGIGGIIGGGIFATMGLAGSEARGATDLSFLVGGIVALLTAYSYIRLSLTYPGKGGTVTFINRAFGTGIFAAGLNTLLVFSYIVVMALYASAFGTYGASLVSASVGHFWHQILTSGVIVVLALINLLSPNLVDRSESIFNVGKLSILMIFIVAGFASSGITFQRLGPADWVPLPKIVSSGMLVFLSYEGFELIANASDRVLDPERTLPCAYYGSILIAISLYVCIVVVTLGHLSFGALARVRDFSLCAAAELFMGKTGFVLLAIGAVLATASAINADFFGASKLPIMLAEAGEAPQRYGREVLGRYPMGLIMIAVLALLVANFVDLHAIAAASSGGFLLVFAMVSISNATLAEQTGSMAWLSVIGGLGCFGALGTMLYESGRDPTHRHEVALIGGLIILPFLYQVCYRAVRRRGTLIMPAK